MSSKKFALAGGSVMLLWGLFALIPTLSVYNQSLPELKLSASYGYFLGIFPMNILNKVALIFFGAAGIACSNASWTGERVLSPSVIWSRVVLYAMAFLAILGMFVQTNTFGGYWPLFGSEIWFHSLWAVLGGYFGYVALRTPSKRSTHGSWSRT